MERVNNFRLFKSSLLPPYLLKVDVVQVVSGVHGLDHPALGSVEVQGEEGRLRHVQELGHRAGRETAVGLKHHLRLQHMAVKTGRKHRRSPLLDFTEKY